MNVSGSSNAIPPILLQPLPRAPGLANFMGTYMQSAITADSTRGGIPSIQESIEYLHSTDELFVQGIIDQYTVYSETISLE
jgi:hypothetical protein